LLYRRDSRSDAYRLLASVLYFSIFDHTFFGAHLKQQGSIGILVSGGPAPGINSVISAVVDEGHRRGLVVKGLRHGFKGLATGEPNAVVDISMDEAFRICHTGGSILGTSRFNPLSSEETRDAFIQGLFAHGINKLVVIGGEGSAYVSNKLSEIEPDLQVVHVPKTIDNDLILPNRHPSFGFETARYVGTNILHTLMTDAKTCERWFLVTSMGRKAGFLALGLGIAARATLTLIPEEFAHASPTPKGIAEIIFESIKKRKAQGYNYGVVILAEGIIDAIDPLSCPALQNCTRDELGRIRYSSIELPEVILPPLKALCEQAKVDVRINTKNIGYELRCHDPVSFDIEYTTILGYGAVRLLEQGATGVMVVRDFDNVRSVELSQMTETDGSIRSRRVELESDLYATSRSFMIR
jgi:ATP-dependent phosphofructokinase / diphosphate-dependent phosphofructokinase